MKAKEAPWKTHYKNWQASQQTQATYCKAENLSHTQFKNRIAKLRREGELPKVRGLSDRQTKSFQPIKIVDSRPESPKTPYCELTFNGTDTITINSPESLQQLKGLIQCLMQA